MSFLHRLKGLPSRFLASIAFWSCFAFLGSIRGEADEVESNTSFGNDSRLKIIDNGLVDTPDRAACGIGSGPDSVLVLEKPQSIHLKQLTPSAFHSTQRAPWVSDDPDVRTTLQVDSATEDLLPAPARSYQPLARPQPHRKSSSFLASASSRSRLSLRPCDIGPAPSSAAPSPPLLRQKSPLARYQATKPPAANNSRHHAPLTITSSEGRRDASFVRSVTNVGDSQLSTRTVVKTASLAPEKSALKSPKGPAMRSLTPPPGRDRLVSLTFGDGPKSWNVIRNTLRPNLAFGMDDLKLPPIKEKVPTFTVYVANRLYTSLDDIVQFDGYISRPGINFRDRWESSMSRKMIGKSEHMGRDDFYTKYHLTFGDWNSAFSVDMRPGRRNLQLSVQVFHLTVKDLTKSAAERAWMATDNLGFEV